MSNRIIDISQIHIRKKIYSPMMNSGLDVSYITEITGARRFEIESPNIHNGFDPAHHDIRPINNKFFSEGDDVIDIICHDYIVLGKDMESLADKYSDDMRLYDSLYSEEIYRDYLRGILQAALIYADFVQNKRDNVIFSMIVDGRHMDKVEGIFGITPNDFSKKVDSDDAHPLHKIKNCLRASILCEEIIVKNHDQKII